MKPLFWRESRINSFEVNEKSSLSSLAVECSLDCSLHVLQDAPELVEDEPTFSQIATIFLTEERILLLAGLDSSAPVLLVAPLKDLVSMQTGDEDESWCVLVSNSEPIPFNFSILRILTKRRKSLLNIRIF